MTTYTCAVLTTSDKGAKGEREDTSGPALRELLAAHGFKVAAHALVPDRIEDIRRVLKSWTDHDKIDLIITTGGTGLTPSDVTPEATRPLLDREIPGMAEAMRAASFAKTPHAVMSRGLAGTRGESLLINLPGSRRAALENIEVLLPALPHALAKIKGDPEDCQAHP
ncbi:MogA/MoaB family molybdenum cofactor biosynthesis protein [Desulfurivibrio alkaliphilus]|uniref:Molybdenum cofactor biosynthesis protein B n=1 Tax=Desulfurivibrio alkaliphilus (strain DSM 19089 / UNIQEM U267 / AHT2) TaxID=589865 RepID=D6Z2K3_DESAT|nr:MogA/MoaB family molybdenum cofactor biosynthesis protein [Desulfurivibrio alkaliphilus]ADH85778.1 molybdenum cofactor synthesis domain protein [Desulfurivibrio alkaliphilus AHT 2]